MKVEAIAIRRGDFPVWLQKKEEPYSLPQSMRCDSAISEEQSLEIYPVESKGE